MTGLEMLQAGIALLSVSAVPSDPDEALAEASALLAAEQQLRVLAMRRIADVDARSLHEAEGHRSVQSWVRSQRPDGSTADAWLGSALRGFAVLSAAVEDGTVSMGAAGKVVRVLRQAGRHVDNGDGRIDGYPAHDVLQAVVGHVVTLVCRHLHGLDDSDPRLELLVKQTEAILDEGGSELFQFEAACTLLASEVPVSVLTPLLDELLVSLVPSLLEARAEASRELAGLELALRSDGLAWRLRGDLDLECGERLFVALRSEASRDPANPSDTALWVHNRDTGVEPWDDVPLRPRDKRRRLHDALDRLLTRYLDAGLGGLTGKVPVQLNVLIPAGDSLPAHADSGALIPRAMVRRWWCDASVTAFVLGLGGKALRVVHGQRTLSRRERRALGIETGGSCAVLDCPHGPGDPLTDLVPHHVRMFSVDGRTSIDETLMLCPQDHRSIHDGRVLLLRDGRYVTEQGITDQLPPPTPPPF
jgi:hypothetical protein